MLGFVLCASAGRVRRLFIVIVVIVCLRRGVVLLIVVRVGSLSLFLRLFYSLFGRRNKVFLLYRLAVVRPDLAALVDDFNSFFRGNNFDCLINNDIFCLVGGCVILILLIVFLPVLFCYFVIVSVTDTHVTSAFVSTCCLQSKSMALRRKISF